MYTVIFGAAQFHISKICQIEFGTQQKTGIHLFPEVRVVHSLYTGVKSKIQFDCTVKSIEFNLWPARGKKKKRSDCLTSES